MLELLLVRHGQTEWNANRKVMGRQPVPLNEAGRAQALALAGELAGTNLAAIVSSPIARARETAEILAAKQNGVAIETDDAFAELDYGAWVNCSFDELSVRFAEEWRTYRHDPGAAAFSGGESIRAAAERIGPAVDRLVARVRDGRVLLVSHADVLKIALVHLLRADLAIMARMGIDNCAPLLVRFYDDIGPRLVVLNWWNFLGKEL
jgi:ribonuclease H / adenosylcobalamin/alpha-ribazole phosphatase